MIDVTKLLSGALSSALSSKPVEDKRRLPFPQRQPAGGTSKAAEKRLAAAGVKRLKRGEIFLTLGYVAWWALGGWVFGAGLQALFQVEVATVCALGNVIVGLLCLLPVVADERRRHLFYDGPRNDEAPDLWIGLLWVFPSTALFLGLLWWLMGWLR